MEANPKMITIPMIFIICPRYIIESRTFYGRGRKTSNIGQSNCLKPLSQSNCLKYFYYKILRILIIKFSQFSNQLISKIFNSIFLKTI